MSTPNTAKSTTPSTVNNKPAVEPVKAPEAASTSTSATVETPKTDAQGDNTASKVIISISVEPKLARQARLLARFNGVSISSLFTDAASHAIPIALKAALADLKEEVE